MKRIILIVSLLALSVAFQGCSSLVAKDESQWTVSDYFLHLKRAYDNEQWEQTIEYGEKLLAYHPYGKEAEQAYLYLAYAYYKWDEPQSAIRTLNEFIKLYPRHRVLPYAYYLRARAAESVSSSWFDRWITDPARRSAESLKQAFDYYKAVAEKFPKSQYAAIARRKMIIFYNRLARHELHIARFYFDREAWLAAVGRVQRMLAQYPRATATLDGIELMARAYEKLGMDVQARHARSVLAANLRRQVRPTPKETPQMKRQQQQLERKPTHYRNLRWSTPTL